MIRSNVSSMVGRCFGAVRFALIDETIFP